jgi:uncharacterized protein (DUF1330 family)
MPAYVVTEIEVRDPEGHEAYRQAAPSTLEAFGGKIVAHGGEVAVLEGDGEPKRMVVAEFPDLDAAKRWYASDAYQAAKKLREHTATLRMVAVEGA